MRGIRVKAGVAIAIAIVAGASAGAIRAVAEQVPDHMTLLESLGTQAVDDCLDQLRFPAGATVHVVPEAPSPANWMVARIFERALVARGFRVVSPALGREGGAANAGPAAAGTGPPKGAGQPGMHPSGAGAQGRRAPQPEEESEPGEAEMGAGTAGGAAPADSLEAGADSAGTVTEEPETEDEAPAEPEETTPTEPVLAPDFEMLMPASGVVLTFRVVEFGIDYPWVKRSLLIGPQRYGRLASVRIWASHVVEPGLRVAGTARGERVRVDSFPGWARPLLEGQNYPFPLQVPEGSSLKGVVEPVVVAGIVAGLVYLFYQNQK